ncbi:unnamed protein product [Mycena citricolor]|uniref:mannan endo-1,4-beta-mannosidase n=1 Tax=Mycena citricolor TaxID=2018698 RepID=A0AAD2K151_9AGAR|nr:unnamed protein product [Mycena citricolor]
MLRTGFLALSLASVALAQAPIYGQCGGGPTYTGPTRLTRGGSVQRVWLVLRACVFSNPFYSQCIPGAAGTTTAPPTPPTSAPGSSTTAVSTTVAALPPITTGFVKTSGTRFTLNGKPYTVAGTNAYWMTLFGYGSADLNTAMNDIVNSGSTTFRTWGFNEVTSPSGIYFNLWNGATATVNTGANGLAYLDGVIALAKSKGLHMIIALTNNWGDYGGMEVYTKQILGSGQPHDAFYTNPTVIAAFKSYVKTVVTRYANEPTIMVLNEPRCGGTSAASAACNNTVITAWASNISAYIKTLDTNHLVAIGDEGFINQPGNFDYPYSGGIGIDFNANLQIKTLDFGTLHMYPNSWGESANAEAWGVQWIKDHATMMTAANKPVILEEFGVTSSPTRLRSTPTGSQLSGGPTPDDGNMIFPTDPVYKLMQQNAAALKARG